MTTIYEAPLGSNPLNKPQAVFLAITCVHPAWLNYDGISEEERQTLVPLSIFAMRWDGLIGFIGGAVDPGESLLQAVAREAAEEAGIQPPSDHASSWALVSSHDLESICVHLFSWSVDFETFSFILRHQHLAQHHMAEGTLFAAQCRNYGPKKRSFDEFSRQNFATGALDQMKSLFAHLGWDQAFGQDSPLAA